MKKSKFLEAAIRAAKEAGRIQEKNLGHIRKIEQKKSPSDLVTNVDKACEKKIISMLTKQFPEHSILSEEAGETKKSGEYEWVIDPIDGTDNYIMKLPLFAVSIALSCKGRVITGVCYFPMLKRMYYAEKGKGAYLNGKKIHVSGASLKKSRFFCSSSVHKSKTFFRNVKTLAFKVLKLRFLGSAVLNLVSVADGTTGLSIEYKIKPWDIAAASLIVEEAGGRVTDNRGNKWNMYNEYIVATNGKIHNKVLKLIK